MAFHLTGTGFYETVRDETFEATREFWPQEIVSEDLGTVYRAEYLAPLASWKMPRAGSQACRCPR